MAVSTQHWFGEGAVDASDWKFRRLLDVLPAAAYTCDASGLITSFNERAVETWGRAPLLNDPIDRFCGSFKLFGTDGAPIAHDRCWMAQALKENAGYNGCEIVVERPDGTRRNVLAYANPLRDDAGTLVGAVNVLVDITDRHRAEQALRDADRRKDDFLAILAHELRNPLAPLRNALQLLSLDSDNATTREQARAMMERQLHQMVRLVDDLMDAARITRGSMVLQKERIDLLAVLHSAIEDTRPFIEQCGHTLAATLPSRPIFIDGDLTRLTQVFTNLITNASKYMRPGGRIEICGAITGREAVVQVRDAGIGIPADMLELIFEPFTQVDASVQRAHGGLGIGLSLVRGMVDMHGGAVEAHSDGPGCGSEFVVRLPVLADSASMAEPPNERIGLRPAFVGRRVLVVDDNADSAASMSMLLNCMGHETATANDGLAAFATAEAFRPEVVLLDIGLPKLNGYATAERIRQQPWGRSILLVALTGWGHEDARRRAAEAGFDLHMVKPIEPAALEHLLAQLQRKSA